MSEIRLGIDLGGSKIEIIALSVADNHDNDAGCHLFSKEVYRHRIVTPKGDYAATLDAIAGLVTAAETELKCIAKSIGIGIPGAISYKTGRIKNANSTWLIGEDLKGDLESRLKRTIALANDANCFALSEAIDGAASTANPSEQVVFGVIIGTGCGGGVVVNGGIINGINAISGEWGHNPLPWLTEDDEKLDCYCGLSACIETFLSGSGFEQHYFQRTGQKQTAQQIMALSQRGDKDAVKLLEDYTVWLAKGLASVINVIDPDVIVLGGGMSNISSLYEEVPKIWQQWVFSDQVDTQLLPPKYGDSSGVRGAAWLGLNID